MAFQNLPKEGLVKLEVLRGIAEVRLREAECLRQNGLYAGAVYLAGYAVECLLKAAICKTLGWGELRSTFAVHDLEGLLLHSGLQRAIEKPDHAAVLQNFVKVKEVWIVAGKQSIRYADPSSFTKSGAARFLERIQDPSVGVATWLRALL